MYTVVYLFLFSVLFPTQLELKNPQLKMKSLVKDEKGTADNNDRFMNHRKQRKTHVEALSKGKEHINDSHLTSNGYNEKDMLKSYRIFNSEKNHYTDVHFCNKRLNDEQKAAVGNILLGQCRPIPYVIFGPPGKPVVMLPPFSSVVGWMLGCGLLLLSHLICIFFLSSFLYAVYILSSFPLNNPHITSVVIKCIELY